jgi:hypothetical protein
MSSAHESDSATFAVRKPRQMSSGRPAAGQSGWEQALATARAHGESVPCARRWAVPGCLSALRLAA